MTLERRSFLHLTAAALVGPVVPHSAWAQAYPTRPIHIIVGFPAGLGPDITARLLGQALSERLGRPVIIENRPGAASNVGTEMVVRAPPDGYTLLMAATPNAINATLYENLNFNFIRDIAPVWGISRGAFVMVVNPSVPAKTVPEFIAYAKANPGKISMASSGIGSPPHVFGELFKMMAGVELVHVPYRSSSIPDLLAGQVQVAFNPTASQMEYIRARKLRALGVTTATRVEALPDVPTIGEFLPGYEASGWLGLGAPKGTSIEIIAKLNGELNAIIADADMKARFLRLGNESMAMTPDEFGKFIVADTEKWATVIRVANLTRIE